LEISRIAVCNSNNVATASVLLIKTKVSLAYQSKYARGLRVKKEEEDC